LVGPLFGGFTSRNGDDGLAGCAGSGVNDSDVYIRHHLPGDAGRVKGRHAQGLGNVEANDFIPEDDNPLTALRLLCGPRFKFAEG